MSTLDSYPLYYEDINPTTRKGGKDSKMSKNTKQVESPTAKTYNKTRGEHVKGIVIAILVTAIIGFVGGMQFTEKQNAKVSEAVNAVTATQTAEAATVKK